MPGKRSSKGSRLRNVSYCYDESLSPRIGELLAAVDYPIVQFRKGVKDEELIPAMGKCGHTWITKDNRSKTQHEALLREARISVVWVRGLTHERRKRKGSIQRTVRMKDVLKMLVNKLDELTEILEKSRSPRHFILYMTASGKVAYDRFTSLREVHGRLAGLMPPTKGSTEMG